METTSKSNPKRGSKSPIRAAITCPERSRRVSERSSGRAAPVRESNPSRDREGADKLLPRTISECPLAAARGSDSTPIPLYPYQERWVRDGARFKLAVKATQIGYSFAAALEAVLDCLQHRTLWIVLSRGERQSLEFMQKAREHAQALCVVGSKLETSFFEKKTDILQHEVKFPNGSRILGLPANPDTARGYTGNMILDEFAFHQHDREIWAAAFGRLSRGDLKLRVISTPNGRRGKYFELAKEVGLVEGNPDADRVATIGSGAHRPARSAWSGHWCDVHQAVGQGCPMDLETLRRAIGDEEAWQQEYECVFLSDRENYIPMDLILACQHPEATTSLAFIPSHVPSAAEGDPEPCPERSRGIAEGESRDRHLPPESRELYFGYDVGRVRDLAVIAVVEKLGDVFWTRALVELPGAKFSVQEQALADLIPFCARGAVDSTGLGMEMAERLADRFPGKVEPVAFTAARKQEMAIQMKRHFEERTLRIPDHRELRRDLNAVKRTLTSAGNLRFDAERTDQGHADRFWALALALQAAGNHRPIPAAWGGLESERDWYGPLERSPESEVRSQKPWA